MRIEGSPTTQSPIATGAERVGCRVRRRRAGRRVVRTSSWGMHWLERICVVDGLGMAPSPPAIPAILAGTAACPARPRSIPSTPPSPSIFARFRTALFPRGTTPPPGGWEGLARARRGPAAGARSRGDKASRSFAAVAAAGFPSASSGRPWRTRGRPQGCVCQRRPNAFRHIRRQHDHGGRSFALSRGSPSRPTAVAAVTRLRLHPSEYPHAGLEDARGHRSRRRADRRPSTLEVRVGAGATCGEEETMLRQTRSRERGRGRRSLPFPRSPSAFGRPTVVNNVLNLADCPPHPRRRRGGLCALGHAPLASARRPSSSPANVRHGGLFEAPFGMTPRRARDGPRRRHGERAACEGGPGGRTASAPTCRRRCSTSGSTTRRSRGGTGSSANGRRRRVRRHGGHARAARFSMLFTAGESCGKCHPLPHRRRSAGWSSSTASAPASAGARQGGVAAADAQCQEGAAPPSPRKSDLPDGPAAPSAPCACTQMVETRQESTRYLVPTEDHASLYGSPSALGGFAPIPVFMDFLVGGCRTLAVRMSRQRWQILVEKSV